MGEIIAVASGKGGVGKSTFATLLGLCLARLGKKCVLVDMDMGLRSLDLMLGVEDKIVYDLADVADGVCALRQAVLPIRSIDGLSLVAASITRDSGALTAMEMEQIANKLAARFDYVLVDCPAGIGRGFRNALAAADHVIVLTTPDAVAMRDAARVIGLARQKGVTRVEAVLNRMSLNSAERAREFAKEHGVELLGIVPNDNVLGALSGHPERLYHTAACGACQRIARRLLGESVRIPGHSRGNVLARGAARFRAWLEGDSPR